MLILLYLVLLFSGSLLAAGIYSFWKDGVMDTNVASYFGRMLLLAIVFILSLVGVIYS